MRRMAALALAALACVAPDRLSAQDPEAPADPVVTRRPAVLDLGLYVGGAWSTDWFEAAGEGFSPGTAPLVGAIGTYWLSPTVGVRAHGAYMPSRVPEGDATFPDNDWVFNNWLYDLDVVWRPWGFRSDVGRFQGSAYVIGGVGAISANQAGPAEGQTSLAVTAGLGADVARLWDRYGVFGEVAVYGYPGPIQETGTARGKTAFSVVGRFGLRRDW